MNLFIRNSPYYHLLKYLLSSWNTLYIYIYIYIYIQTHVRGKNYRSTHSLSLNRYSLLVGFTFLLKDGHNTNWIGSCLGFGSGLNFVGAKIFRLFRSVRSRLCSGWLLTVRNSCDKRAERSVRYRKPVLNVFECIRRRAWSLLREYYVSEARRHDCRVPKN